MRRVAWRLDDKSLQIEVRGQATLRGDPAKNRSDQLVELGEEIHRSPIYGATRRLGRALRKDSMMPSR